MLKEANDWKATTLPLPEMTGAKLACSRWKPAVDSETRVVRPVPESVTTTSSCDPLRSRVPVRLVAHVV